MADVFVLSDFLHLYEGKKLSHSTLEGYMAAIGKVLQVTSDWYIGSDAYISGLFANLARDRVVQRNSMPSWNLVVILESLLLPLFEPMN